jgi:7-cyano-7-deazaguanine reductase
MPVSPSVTIDRDPAAADYGSLGACCRVALNQGPSEQARLARGTAALGKPEHTMPKKSLELTHLGQSTRIPESPERAILDRVPNPHPDTRYVARFTAPEFTALCPVTGQPDFAHLVIDYVPAGWLVESKSLKLYLASFRSHGAFHEDCTVAIGKRIVALVAPHYLRIGGYWYPRGGMPIDVFWQTGELPKEVWLPDQGVSPYRGRG